MKVGGAHQWERKLSKTLGVTPKHLPRKTPCCASGAGDLPRLNALAAAVKAAAETARPDAGGTKLGPSSPMFAGKLRSFCIAGQPAVEVDRAKGPDGVYFGDVLIDEALWLQLEDRFATELRRFVDAAGKLGTDELPTSMEALKAFSARGMTKAKKAKEAAQAAEIDAKLAELTGLLEALQARGAAPESFVVYVAGPDAAGKSSTGGIVLEALEAAGFSTRRETFKAPTEAEKKQHWLARYDRGKPAKGEVVFWDRGPAGDAVYAPREPLEVIRMARDFTKLEKSMRSQGILPVKIELYADQEKQADTLGKRMARQTIARHIEQALTARGELTADKKAQLDDIAGRLDEADFRAIVSYPEVQEKFERFVGLTESVAPWVMVDATKRHGARLKIIDAFIEQLRDFADGQDCKAA